MSHTLQARGDLTTPARKTVSYFLCLCLIALVMFISWGLQSRLLISWDVSWLMHASERLLAGGTYSKNFFEINPPLILYLYLPPVMLAKLLQCTVMTSMRIYLFALGVLSLSLSAYLCNFIFARNTFLQTVFLTALACVYFLLPSFEFGQRENLMVLLSFPYLLMTAARLQGKSFTSPISLLIGTLAGLGFALKPFFLLAPLFVEIYYSVRRKNIFAFYRTETLTILTVLALYAVSVILFFPDYLQVVIPATIHIYPAFTVIWPEVLAQPLIVFCELSLLFFVLSYKTNPYQNVCDILLLGILSYLISFFIQHTLWYYHIYPALGLSLLLTTIILTVFLQKTHASNAEYLGLGSLGFIFFTYLFYSTDSVWITVAFKLLLLFALFVSLALAYRSTHKVPRICAIIFTCVAWGFLIYYFNLISYWSEQRVILAIACLLLLLGLFVPKTKTYHLTFFTLLAIVTIAYPVKMNYAIYQRLQTYKHDMQPLIAFLHKNVSTQSSVYFFSTRAGWEFPAVDYAGTQPAGRMAFLGWLPAIVKQERSSSPHLLDADKKYFINMTNEDLAADKPEYIFVETERFKPYLDNIEFDHIAFFSQDPAFQTLWKTYHYVATIDVPGTYTFEAYRRKSSGLNYAIH